MHKEPPKLENIAFIIGFAVQIFVAGLGWGTVWTKLCDLEKRFDRFESFYNNKMPKTEQTPPNPWYNVVPPAAADTLKEDEKYGIPNSNPDSRTSTSPNSRARHIHRITHTQAN